MKIFVEEKLSDLNCVKPAFYTHVQISSAVRNLFTPTGFCVARLNTVRLLVVLKSNTRPESGMKPSLKQIIFTQILTLPPQIILDCIVVLWCTTEEEKYDEGSK